MNKTNFFNSLLATLREEALNAVNASRDAAAYATNEESRAESQWDTQGLEASYLAAGQAGQARQWADAIEELQSEREELLQPKTQVSFGALFCCDFGGFEEHFFFAGTAGGQVIKMESYEVTVITAQSPLAGRLLGRRAGDSFGLPNGSSGQVLTVE
ncbi:MAG TPA: transcription elongation factor GreAB [Opitutae bacterium]|nr:transcription elongation factor GreAB [Puniceicoccaceae bacterium]HBR95042.1 transcription elongation factor GreAB [Opitutae bacterium]|tara:strand:+ start:1994 stop:2464 length:471 start_codon:yes stop_codon:yes gene_type:complete